MVLGQDCSPTFNWNGGNCGVNCEACLTIRFNNLGRGDQACLRRSTFAPADSTACIYQGNLNGDGSFIAVTSSTLSRNECRRSLKDLEVRTFLHFSIGKIFDDLYILFRFQCLLIHALEVSSSKTAESVVLPPSSFQASGKISRWMYPLFRRLGYPTEWCLLLDSISLTVISDHIW